MISEIHIKNFKSIRDLVLKPGRVTVLIGENGSGKSNILESIAFANAATTNRLDGAYLSARGVRVTEDTWMKSAFPVETPTEADERDEIVFSFAGEKGQPKLECVVSSSIREEDGSFAGWTVMPDIQKSEIEKALLEKEFHSEVRAQVEKLMKRREEKGDNKSGRDRLENALTNAIAHVGLLRRKEGLLGEMANTIGLSDFAIFSPENSSLRAFEKADALQPLGVKGEGLLKLVQSFGDANIRDVELSSRLSDLKERLHIFGWFEDFNASEDAAVKAKLQIRDRWLAADKALFDQRSANEGFLYVLFYFALLISWRTPRFFAIDNVDSALNPKLCAELMKQLVGLAKKYQKQVICTTHNPAVLDGLDLHDDEQRLFTVRRDLEGCTTVRRVGPPQTLRGEKPVRLSEAFQRGLIGGLPEHF